MSNPNPYNLRGALIQPSGNTAIYYFLIVIDYDSSSTIDGIFTLANPEETGNILTYSYSGIAANLIAPQSPATTKTLALPIYYNQQINAPDLKPGDPQNLTVTLTVGQNIVSSGNPYFLHPPIVEVMQRSDQGFVPYTTSGVVLKSTTAASSPYFLVFMVNTNTLDVGNPLSYSTIATNASSSEPGQQMYNVQIDFGTTPPSTPGPIAAIGVLTTTIQNLSSILVNPSYPNPNGIQNPLTPINYSPLPASNYTF